MKNYCIVKNEKFEVETYQEDDRPVNFVIEQPGRNSGYGYDYIISSNDVKLRWTNGTYQGQYISFSYKGVVINKSNCFNLQSLSDRLNKYKNNTAAELEGMLIIAQKAIKTDLEKTIETLQLEKKELETKLFSLKRILVKVEEIKELFTSVDG